MASDFDLPRIAAWVARVLPKGHPFRGDESGVLTPLEIWQWPAVKSYAASHALAEALLLDAMAASGRLVGVQAPVEEFALWSVDIIAGDNGIDTFDAPTRLAALLAAADVVSKEGTNNES